MAEPEPGDDFENFPRGRLAMRLPRRRLWSALVTGCCNGTTSLSVNFNKYRPC